MCDLFLEGAQRSARLTAEGRSIARGTPPAWLIEAADLRISRFEQGSLDLGLRASRLVDVAPDLFAQQQLIPPGMDADSTAFDLFLDAAEDAAAGKRDSERLDAGVLDVLGRAATLFSRGGTRLSIDRGHRASVVLDAAAATLILSLANETPEPRVFRVRGVLDTLTVSTRAILLRLEDGKTLRGFAGSVDLDQLKQLLGTVVVLEGTVSFRPSGDALRLEVDSALPASEGDAIWAELPKADASTRPFRASQSASDLDAFFGRWPGDETDAMLVHALRDLA